MWSPMACGSPYHKGLQRYRENTIELSEIPHIPIFVKDSPIISFSSKVKNVLTFRLDLWTNKNPH